MSGASLCSFGCGYRPFVLKKGVCDSVLIFTLIQHQAYGLLILCHFACSLSVSMMAIEHSHRIHMNIS